MMQYGIFGALYTLLPFLSVDRVSPTHTVEVCRIFSSSLRDLDYSSSNIQLQ